MALGTVYTNVGTYQNDPTSRLASSRLKATEVYGKLRLVTATYALDASEAAATDVIRICKLKKGSSVIPQLSSIYIPDTSSGSGTLVVSVGDNDTTADADRYADALDVSAGGFFDFSASGTVPVAAADVHQIEGDDDDIWLEVTLDTVTSIDTDVTITFTIVVSDE